MRRSALLMTLMMAAACDPTGPGNSGSFAITPNHVVIQPGDTVVLAFTTTNVLVTPVAWRSLNTSLANVDSLGRVIALAPGLDSIEVSASTEDEDLADSSTVAVTSACPGAPFIAGVNLAGTSTPAHLESIAAPVDIVAAGMCAGPRSVQTLSLVVSAIGPGERTVASIPVPDPVPNRWRPLLTLDPSMKDGSGTRVFPTGDYTLSIVWTTGGGSSNAAALPITIRTP